MFSGDQVKAFMSYERGYQVNYFSVIHQRFSHSLVNKDIRMSLLVTM